MFDKTTNRAVIICRSVEETHKLTAQILKQLFGGEIIGLSGELGAGKTEFVRGAAMVIGAQDDVSSPSYTLQNIYKRSNVDIKQSSECEINTIYHWDLYRAGIDLNELLEGKHDAKSVTFIEWVEKFPEIEGMLDIKIGVEVVDETTRQFTIIRM